MNMAFTRRTADAVSKCTAISLACVLFAIAAAMVVLMAPPIFNIVLIFATCALGSDCT
jgi:hypothetical protein